jgi:beta-1,4-N-acetylglucosaminyltransferase
MIFVTVGTTHFDDLIREVDRLVRVGEIREEVLAQIGEGQYVPSHIKWIRYAKTLEPYFEEADLVICHGGVGSVFELLRMGKPFIAVANKVLQHDHQADFLRAMQARGWCAACYDVADLTKALANRPRSVLYQPDHSLTRSIWDFLSAEGGRRK